MTKRRTIAQIILGLTLSLFLSRLPAGEGGDIENITSLEELDRVMALMPVEKRAALNEKIKELIERIKKQERQKYKEKLRTDYESGRLPEPGHPILGDWLNDRKEKAFSFRADGTFTMSQTRDALQCTWRIAPDGTIILRFPRGDPWRVWVSKDEFTVRWEYHMDYIGPTFYKDTKQPRS